MPTNHGSPSISITGDSIYIRSAANSNSTSISSAYATVTAPPNVAAPATDYDTSTHSILGLMSNMDFRIGFPDGWSDWIQSPADNVYFNAYPYLSTSYGTQAQVRYRNSPDVVQTHNISALRPAPTGLSFEWLNGVGLVLWGFEAGHYYNFMTDPYFDDWYVYDADMYGINLSGFGLMPGDALYVREAANSSSETSACLPAFPPSRANRASAAGTA